MRTDSTTVGSFYEFFAGGGLARVGLGPAWNCLFANDIDHNKVTQYKAVFGAAEIVEGDVSALDATTLPRGADLAWASFPCQDLSLAGARGGLSARRSGAFWGFWRAVQGLGAEAPPVITLENVTGLLTSHGGADFSALVAVLSDAGYAVGALCIDAASFLPQSRPRIFIVAVRGAVPASLRAAAPGPFHGRALVEAAKSLPLQSKSSWIWWRLPEPPRRNMALVDMLEPDDMVEWREDGDTARLLSLMAARQRTHIEMLRATETRHIGAAFRRMRVENGAKVQRVEARFDGLAGCLRTPAGGSSRQTLLVVENGKVRSRLLTPRECARLMGLGDDYPLPSSTNAALHLMGDAVATPAVRWLSEHLLAPLVATARKTARAA
ncbi:MAG: DNA cytosine methyltransferase [Pseudomonadota bacterium]